MRTIYTIWDSATAILSGRIAESIAQLAARVALGMMFWRSYGTKVVEGTWFNIDETQYFIFENEFTGLPLSPDIAVPLTTFAEFAFPLLLFAGLATRFSAAALMVMALVIQIFVFPTWDHFLGWDITVLALGAFLVSRGGGLFALDALLGRLRPARTP